MPEEGGSPVPTLVLNNVPTPAGALAAADAHAPRLGGRAFVASLAAASPLLPNTAMPRPARAKKARRHALSAVGPQFLDGDDGDDDDEAMADADDAGAARDQRRRPRPSSTGERNSGRFRFWTDERRFKGSGDRCIVQRALFAAGGVRTGGWPKAAPMPGPLGYQRPADWDFLWSPARTALRAVPSLKPGQLISAMPGIFSLTKKRRLSRTLKDAYGADAFDLMPLSFSLPDELPAYRAWLDAAAAERRDPGPWMLKTAQHLGLGLRLAPGEAAYAAASRPRPSSAKPYVVAQRYVADPLLIAGRKFGLRVWVLVSGHAPLRAYMHGAGLVLFSTAPYDAAAPLNCGGSNGNGGASSSSSSSSTVPRGAGHVTNYAQNVDGTVWDLPQLEAHLGAAPYARLIAAVERNAAMVVAAGLGDVAREHEKLRLPVNATFELLGLDYLVDTSLHPWLLEVNGTPSLAVEHADPDTEGRIGRAKGSMASDMVRLLDCRSRFAPRYKLVRAAVKGGIAGAARLTLPAVRRLRDALTCATDEAALGLAARELRLRGGFSPLMPLFPVDAVFEKGYAVPWSTRDYRLREKMAAAAAAAAGVMTEGAEVQEAEGEGEQEAAAAARDRGGGIGGAAVEEVEETEEAAGVAPPPPLLPPPRRRPR